MFCFWFFVFFFKQKTAYEMRISDWSSDVCSSDLEQADSGHRVREPVPGRHRAQVQRRHLQQRRADLEPHLLLELPGAEGRRQADRRPGARKSVVEGKGVSVRVDTGGSSIIKKKIQLI